MSEEIFFLLKSFSHSLTYVSHKKRTQHTHKNIYRVIHSPVHDIFDLDFRRKFRELDSKTRDTPSKMLHGVTQLDKIHEITSGPVSGNVRWETKSITA